MLRILSNCYHQQQYVKISHCHRLATIASSSMASRASAQGRKTSHSLNTNHYYNFSSENTSETEAGTEAGASMFISNPTHNEYLVFPVKFPIFPYYICWTRINRYMHEFLQKNNIQYVSAFALKPGAKSSIFEPRSLNHLEQFLKVKPPIVNKRSLSNATNFEVTNNNLIIDENYHGTGEVPVKYIDSIDKIFEVGSVCKIQTEILPNGDYIAQLRSEIRIRINPEEFSQARHNLDNPSEAAPYENEPITYLSGEKCKTEQISSDEEDYQKLLKLYVKIAKLSTINLPDVANLFATKTVELLSGYLCTLRYFTEVQLFELFQMTKKERLKCLLKYFEEYIEFFEKKWEHEEEEKKKLENEEVKEAYKFVYEHYRQQIGLDSEAKYIDSIKKKLEQGNYPEHVKKAIECELQNVEDGLEVNKKKHFINLLIEYPFGVKAKETFDIQKAREILEEEHYGMKKIKQRILEFIAVGKLKGEFKCTYLFKYFIAKVILLHGPPGVGKTSIVKSIAKCLNRPYGRISLGGESETSIVKGHRRTYVGAYPGRIFDIIRKSKAENPIILLDEIDKIQKGSRGNLQDAVMEILDPVQNEKFKDDYIDLDIDLSKVLFVCTANSLDTIFPPLLDRMERIEMTGYTTQEKEEIFKRHIYKKSIEQAGIPKLIQDKIDFTKEAVNAMIEGYCREAGVRNLIRKTDKIFQKMALQIVREKPYNEVIKKEDLKEYIGLPKFYSSRLFSKSPPKGVMIGLAYNAYGGSIMYIESIVISSGSNNSNKKITIINKNSSSSNNNNNNDADKTNDESVNESTSGTLLVTGNIQDVMKESCQLALTYAKYITSTFFDSNFLEENDVHINFPEIEIGKDGPSAGIAITSTLISLALNKPMRQEIGMTGEITLSGYVGAIGGVKEKTIGAKKEGVANLIFPFDNKRDVEDLEPEIKEGMTFHFVEHYFEVLNLVFGIKINEKETTSDVAVVN